MDAQKVRNAIVEMSNSMTRMDAERDLIKEMARVYHKQNFAEESTINEEFETHFKNIMS